MHVAPVILALLVLPCGLALNICDAPLREVCPVSCGQLCLETEWNNDGALFLPLPKLQSEITAEERNIPVETFLKAQQSDDEIYVPTTKETDTIVEESLDIAKITASVIADEENVDNLESRAEESVVEEAKRDEESAQISFQPDPPATVVASDPTTTSHVESHQAFPVHSDHENPPTTPTASPIVMQPVRTKGVNYARSECGANVVFTNEGATTTSSILKKDKDVYMLNKCKAPEKFVVIRLCDDILVQTVSLGMYEFFSSMYKDFKVSVRENNANDWVELGHFVAKNVRGNQDFTIKDPKVWARLIRFDFLTHYSNEYYCPLSSVEVFGKTMLEDLEDGDCFGPECAVTDASVASNTSELPSPDVSSYTVPTKLALPTVPIPAPPTELGIMPDLKQDRKNLDETFEPQFPTSQVGFSRILDLFNPDAFHRFMSSEPLGIDGVPPELSTPASAKSYDLSVPSMAPEENALSVKPNQDAVSLTFLSLLSSPTQSTAQQTPAITPTVLPRPSLPGGGQDSVLKSITKRLTVLERNASLSYKYLEEQSQALNLIFLRLEDSRSKLNQTFTESLHLLNKRSEAQWEYFYRELDRERKVHREIQAQYLSVVESLKEQMIHLMVWNAVLIISLFFGRTIWNYVQGILHGVKETAAEIFQVGSPLGPDRDTVDDPGRAGREAGRWKSPRAMKLYTDYIRPRGERLWGGAAFGSPWPSRRFSLTVPDDTVDQQVARASGLKESWVDGEETQWTGHTSDEGHGLGLGWDGNMTVKEVVKPDTPVLDGLRQDLDQLVPRGSPTTSVTSPPSSSKKKRKKRTLASPK
ncbi:UNC-like C-terminal-domain-containing protein [Cladochytrium replicatum]|nr:UNC-like C-terminal-domain-containing protein [Cladochytrium replicatum]